MPTSAGSPGKPCARLAPNCDLDHMYSERLNYSYGEQILVTFQLHKPHYRIFNRLFHNKNRYQFCRLN